MKLFFSTIICFTLFSLSACLKKEEISVRNKELVPGEWRFHGHLGEYINAIAHARILDQANWDIIYPETEDAFKLREDDRGYPDFGAWRGEFWGKYMLSVIAAAKYYHSDELKGRIAEAVEGLLIQMEENGYLGTYVRSNFLVGNNWNVWGRKYTLWGLVESWELLEDQKILDAAMKFANHLISETGPGAVDIVTTGNFYGMPSTSILQPMVKLYNATGEQKYLNYAEYIVDQWGQHPDKLPDILNKGLSGAPVHTWFPQTDSYKWAKGYEFTSCVEGLVELYKVNRNENYLLAAINIHKVLVEYERTPVGSVSFNDKYIGSTGLINTVAEICDAVYWNRLSFELFKLTGEEKYVDEIERTLYNSLLCAFNADGTWGLRRLRTSHIHIPAQNHFLYHHQCCTDNLPRGLFQAAELTLMKRNDSEIFLSLFNEGEGTVRIGEKIVRFNIKKDFLNESRVKANIQVDQPVEFRLFIRMPRWSDGTTIGINNKAFAGEIVGNWMLVDRKWKNGDKIEISFDLGLHWEEFQPEIFDNTYHDIDFYNEEWAKMKFLGGTYDFNNERYKHVGSLDIDEVLPQEKAYTFFYGPLALSRDVRISGDDVFARISELTDDSSLSITPVPSINRIWKLFDVNLGNGETIRFCDFSSAGNTWDEESLFNTWCLVE